MNIFLTVALAILSFTVSAADQPIDCYNSRDVQSTIDMNECLSNNSVLAEAEMNKYLQASLDTNANDPEVVKLIKIAQKDWETYQSSNCDSVYTLWKGGSIKNAMSINCSTRLTKQRTLELWESYLTSVDGSPPLLPEPK